MDKDLRVLLVVCSIFGIYIPEWNFQSPMMGNVVNTLYLMFLIGIVCFNTVVSINVQPMDKDYIISSFVTVIIFISQMFTYLVIMWEGVTKRQEHIDFLRLLHEIETALKLRLRVPNGCYKTMADLRKWLGTMIVILIAGLVIFACMSMVLDDIGFFWWAIMAILAMRLRLLQLTVYVELLKGFLIGLNQKLYQVVCLRTDNSRRLLDIDYTNLESLECMVTIREMYSSIYDAFYHFNEFAQTSLFLMTASIFLDFTCHIYWTLLAMDGSLPLSSIVLAVTTIAPLGIMIIKFCHICQELKQECQRTSLMVTRLMVQNSALISVELQCNYRCLLYDFSLQLLHQRIEVTGKRFFNFDLQCIFAICALIVTHLIILIQFMKNDGNSATTGEYTNQTITVGANR